MTVMDEKEKERALIALHGRMLSALRVNQGTAWKEVVSELNLHYFEIAVWILLFEDSDPEATHAVLRRTVVPFIEELGCNVQIRLSYYVVRSGERFHLDVLNSTSDVLSASGEELGAWQKLSHRTIWVFDQNHSQRQ